MALTSDNRVSPIAWLIGCVVIGVLCYWYPLVLANSFGRDVDSRIGFIGVLTIPVLLVSSVRAIWEFVRLLKAIATAKRRGDGAYQTAGVVLLVASLSPLASWTASMFWGATR
jgi:hypothetical protein